MLFVTWEPWENRHHAEDVILQPIREEMWRIGTVFPHHIQTECVQMISADGDELLLIINRFKNIPYTTAQVTRWTGEFARFIYENMKFYQPKPEKQ